MIKEVVYKSKDNITDIHAVLWIPDKNIKAILQISHGMIEHILRYEDFALEMNKHGILVCGNDHLGHGDSVIDKKHLGYFAKKNSSDILVDDLYSLTDIVKKRYKDIPIFLLGHSMGSFIARNYIAKYGEEINGAIIIGTGNQSTLKLDMALLATDIIKTFKGEFYTSKFLANQTTDGFHRYFKEDNKHSWLSTNEKVIIDYAKDPKTYFKFTCNGHKTLFTLIKNAKKSSKNIPKTLPIMILSGKDDPVGNFGKDIIKLYNTYKKLNIKNVEYKLYDNMRHEIINETNNKIVYNDIINFITKEELPK